jgi:hypothetical protein
VNAANPLSVRNERQRLGIWVPKDAKWAMALTGGDPCGGEKTFEQRLPPTTVSVRQATITRGDERKVPGRRPERRKAEEDPVFPYHSG